MAKTVLIIEPRVGGHTMPYVRWVAEAAVKNGHHCIVCISDRARNEENIVALTISNPSLELLYMDMASWKDAPDPAKSIFGRQIRRYLRLRNNWKLLRSCWVDCRRLSAIDCTFIMPLDFVVHGIGLFGSPALSGRTVGIIMRFGPWALQGKSLLARCRAHLKNTLLFFALRMGGVAGIFTSDAALIGALNCLRQKVVFLPDAADIQCIPFRPSSKKRGGNILLYGHLGWRKGVREAVELVSHYPFFELTVVGSGDPEVVRYVRKASKIIARIKFIEGFMVRGELDDMIVKSDWVWVAYRNFPWMSGVLTSAIALGTPVICAPTGQIQDLVSKYSLGITFTENGLELRRQAMEYCQSNNIRSREVAEFVSRYSIKNFQRILRRALSDWLA